MTVKIMLRDEVTGKTKTLAYTNDKELPSMFWLIKSSLKSTFEVLNNGISIYNETPYRTLFVGETYDDMYTLFIEGVIV